jgi:hypothetical protein
VHCHRHSRPELNAVAVPDEPRSISLVPDIPERHLSALLVTVDAQCYQPPHFVISEDQVVRFIYGDIELFAGSLHKFDEVSVFKLHVRILS